EQTGPASFAPLGPHIGRATGKITGLTYVPEAPVVSFYTDAMAWNRYLETPSVRRFGGTRDYVGSYTMHYAGKPNFDGFVGISFGRMTSADGVSWSGGSDAPFYVPGLGSWDELFITGPTVVKRSATNWKLYYSGASLIGQGVGLLT